MNGDFPPVAKNKVTKCLEVVPFEEQTDNFKRKLAKSNEAKMVLYNALPKKEYERIFMCKMAKEIWKLLLITHQERPETEDDLTGDILKQYEADIEVKRLMQGTELYKVDRETRFNNECDQFTAETGESLVLVYSRFSQLMNDLNQNKIELPIVTINTKFLNCLQLEWYKYVTNVRLAKDLTKDPYDELFHHLQQYEKLVIASRGEKLENTHDPLALKREKAQSSISVSTEGKRKGHSLFPPGRASKRLHHVKLQAIDWLQGTLEEEQ
ncbi:hypothetical protein Tco_1499341 [Tanacetum coccineum]